MAELVVGENQIQENLEVPILEKVIADEETTEIISKRKWHTRVAAGLAGLAFLLSYTLTGKINTQQDSKPKPAQEQTFNPESIDSMDFSFMPSAKADEPGKPKLMSHNVHVIYNTEDGVTVSDDIKVLTEGMFGGIKKIDRKGWKLLPGLKQIYKVDKDYKFVLAKRGKGKDKEYFALVNVWDEKIPIRYARFKRLERKGLPTNKLLVEPGKVIGGGVRGEPRYMRLVYNEKRKRLKLIKIDKLIAKGYTFEGGESLLPYRIAALPTPAPPSTPTPAAAQAPKAKAPTTVAQAPKKTEPEKESLADMLKDVKYCIGPEQLRAMKKELEAIGKKIGKKLELTFEHVINALIHNGFNLDLSNLIKEQKNALYSLGHQIYREKTGKDINEEIKLKDYRVNGFCEDYILAELRNILGMGGEKRVLDKNAICLLNAYSASDKARKAVKKAISENKSNDEINAQFYTVLDQYLEEMCGTDKEKEIFANLYVDVNAMQAEKFGEGNYLPVSEARIAALSHKQLDPKLKNYCLSVDSYANILMLDNKLSQEAAESRLKNFIEKYSNLLALIKHEAGAADSHKQEHVEEYYRCNAVAEQKLRDSYKQEVVAATPLHKSLWIWVPFGVAVLGGTAAAVCLGTDLCSGGRIESPPGVGGNTDPGDKTYGR